MMVLLLFQVVISSLALARQADVDIQLHDAWGRAAYSDQRMIEKLEKTVRLPHVHDHYPTLALVVLLWIRQRA